jgi:hypothetical protein
MVKLWCNRLQVPISPGDRFFLDMPHATKGALGDRASGGAAQSTDETQTGSPWYFRPGAKQARSETEVAVEAALTYCLD